MNSKGAVVATPTQVYEDFVPSSKLVKEEHCDTIHLNLAGFKKEQMKVILTSTGILKIGGQRPIGQNKWQRFHKEFPVAENCDKSKISAKFENGILRVQQPKIASLANKDKELAARGAENTPAAKRQKTSLRDEFSKQDNAGINTPAKEEPKKASPKIGEQTEAKSVAENKLPADKSSSSSSSSSESESESTDDETDDATTGNTSNYLAANLKKPRKVIKLTLVALSVLGIGLYVANVMKSANEAEE
ncbi:inactive protein RESTRICTED TEV MOVEMENT 2-like [Capsicum chacoense]